MEKLTHIPENQILFLDIETVPMTQQYEQMPEALQKLWDKKANYWLKEGETGKDHFGKAGIYAEFGRIVCISVGLIFWRDGKRQIRIKSYAGHNEHALLSEFAELCSRSFASAEHYLCGHNGKEFDFPYIARRMLINGIRLPSILDMAGRKPWEVRHLDTMELWKFGDYKSYTSLNLLTAIFGIPTPKDDIDGSQVATVYYEEQNLERIVRYCQKDVLATVQLYLKYKGEPMIDNELVSESEIELLNH